MQGEPEHLKRNTLAIFFYASSVVCISEPAWVFLSAFTQLQMKQVFKAMVHQRDDSRAVSGAPDVKASRGPGGVCTWLSRQVWRGSLRDLAAVPRPSRCPQLPPLPGPPPPGPRQPRRGLNLELIYHYLSLTPFISI